MKKCVFAGSFDPFTEGHRKIVEKALCVYDKVIVVVGVNPEKEPFFSEKERLSFIRRCFAGDKRVEAVFNKGLTVDYLKRKNITDYVRGIRNDTDIEYEKTAEKLNRSMYPELKYVYIKCDEKDENVSSSLVKERLLKGESVSDLLPEQTEELIVRTYRDKTENSKKAR